jgi:hypothetical protein
MAEGKGNRGKRTSGQVRPEALLQQLLEESAALQRRSAELADQVKALQEQIRTIKGLERRQRPRLRGK